MSYRSDLAVGSLLVLAAAAVPPTVSAQDEPASRPVRLTAGHPDVDASRLPTGRSVYTMRMGEGDDAREMGEYAVETAPRDGGDALLIVQTTRNATGPLVDSALVRGRGMVPVWYRTHTPRGGADLRYADGGRRVRGTEWTADGDSVPVDTAFAEPRYPSSIAMVVVGALPLRPGYTVEIPASRHADATTVTATVVGRETFDAGAGSRDAWRVEVAFDGRPATRWIAVDDRVELGTRATLPNGATFWQTLASPAESAARARSLLREAVDAMGGEALLRGLGAVRIETMAYTTMLEQSERPEGPYLPVFEESSALRDHARDRLRRTSRSRSPQSPGWTPYMTRIFDGDAAALAVGERTGPGRLAELRDASESLALGPERLLLTALDAEDVRVEPDTVLQGVPHRVVAFTWRDRPVRILLNGYTHLPTAVERTRERPWDQWSVWGDVTTRTLFSFWTLEADGLMYPRQWTIERNDLPARDVLITRLEVGAPAPADSFAIPASLRTAFQNAPMRGMSDLRLGRSFGGSAPEPREIEPGIVFLPGAWNVTLVRQEAGVVVIEAPISSAYTADVVAEAAQRFGDADATPAPGDGGEADARTPTSRAVASNPAAPPNPVAAPVVAAVSTSDAWPHIGGVREYVARGIPVYTHALNAPLLRRVVEAPHTFRLDSLAVAPREPELRTVDEPATVGAGPNRFVLYPVRGEGGERMIAAYFPEHGLLYASDLVQPMPDGSFFMPEYLNEVRLMVEREGLDVETVFAMHSPPMPWSDLLAALPAGTT
ncbi:MAG: MBL fold metallo-hydrolase [Gemmatimonadota bacterium]